MVESMLLLSLISIVACVTALYMDRLDRMRVMAEAQRTRDELKELIEKIGHTHNDLITGMKDVHGKITSMDLRITAVAAASASNAPQGFRGVR